MVALDVVTLDVVTLGLDMVEVIRFAGQFSKLPASWGQLLHARPGSNSPGDECNAFR